MFCSTHAAEHDKYIKKGTQDREKLQKLLH
jgi:hypothetical protein